MKRMGPHTKVISSGAGAPINTVKWTKKEKHELAKHMMARWAAWGGVKELSVSGDGHKKAAT